MNFNSNQTRISFKLNASIILSDTCFYHMTRTAPRALSLQNYRENPRMRAERDGASRAGKSRPALLGSRTALLGSRTALREMRTNFVAI